MQKTHKKKSLLYVKTSYNNAKHHTINKKKVFVTAQQRHNYSTVTNKYKTSPVDNTLKNPSVWRWAAQAVKESIKL